MAARLAGRFLFQWLILVAIVEVVKGLGDNAEVILSEQKLGELRKWRG
jgi:hypothetical protein